MSSIVDKHCVLHVVLSVPLDEMQLQTKFAGRDSHVTL